MAEEVIGFGGNGVVVLRGKEKACVKYWSPHVVKGRLCGSDVAVRLYMASFTNSARQRLMVKHSTFELHYYGCELPLDRIVQVAEKQRVRLIIHSIAQDDSPPACSNYAIANSVCPAPLAQGAVIMLRAGCTLWERIPLSPVAVCSLICDLCTAAHSAFLQGHALVDIKPQNICQNPNNEGWLMVDVEHLPRMTSSRATRESTYTVSAIINGEQAVAASLIITVAIAAGVLSERDAERRFVFSSKFLEPWDSLHGICHPALYGLLSSADIMRSLCAAYNEAFLLSCDNTVAEI